MSKPGGSGAPRKRRPKKQKNQAVKSRGPREVGSLVVQEWQRLPAVLLREWCQRQKRPRARLYANRRGDGTPAMFAGSAVVPDGKRADKDLKFATAETFADQKEAEHNAALLALHHIDPKQPLERRLPEPFKTSWLSLSTDSPLITSFRVHASNSERNAARKVAAEKRNMRQRRMAARGLARVTMSESHRLRIDALLRAYDAAAAADSHDAAAADSPVMMPSTKASSSSGGGGALPASKTPALPEEVASSAAKELRRLGFRDADVQSALLNVGGAAVESDTESKESVVSSAITWLCTHVPEDELPKQFDPRGKQVEVVVKKRVSKLERHLASFGFPHAACAEADQKFPEEQQDQALDYLLGELVLHNFPTTSEEKADGEMVDDEIMALESIFADDMTKVGARCWSLRMPGDLAHCTLRVSVPHNTNYPVGLPLLHVRSPKLAPPSAMHVALSLLREADAMRGAPMIFELFERVQTLAGEVFASKSKPRHDFSGSFPRRWLSEKQQAQLDFQASLFKSSLVASSSSSSAAPKSAPSSSGRASSSFGRASSSKRAHAKRLTRDAALDERLKDELSRKSESSNYRSMVASRHNLPAFKSRADVLGALEESQVLVISGETGCGKSTQIPQYILDDYLESGRGSVCNVICTQPRRISAIGLAERVASERDEPCGASVGYSIRLESKRSKDTRLLYVTTGILLRRLTSGDNLKDISHIIIDEVHERSVDIDFLLVILRELLHKRKELRLVLMSATAKAELFSAYFGDCPMLSIPGRTFPVKDLFLEDVLEMTEYDPPKKSQLRKKSDVDDRMGKLNHLFQSYSRETVNALARLDESARRPTDMALLEATVHYILDTSTRGGILIFLPGIGEIRSICAALGKSLDKSRFWIVPLHGQLQSANQRLVFAKCPKGVRKIVAATNVAETSITVNDVEFVIDSGRMKEIQFDASKHISTLVETHVSKANSIQRKGRAGRVAAGTCFKLYSSLQYEKLLDDQLPEIQRSSLEYVCIQIKLISLGKSASKGADVHRVLRRMIDPPSTEAIEGSIKILQGVDVFDSKVELTPLGLHIAKIPTGNVRISKMMLYGAMFLCVSPMVVICALMSSQSVFVSPFEQREAANQARQRFAVGSSDFLAALNAYRQWNAIERKGDQRKFCSENFLSFNALDNARSVARQFRGYLEEVRFVRRRRGAGGDARGDTSNSEDRYAENIKVLQAVIAAGLYPNVLSVQLPEREYIDIQHGTVAKDHEARDIKFFPERPGPRHFLHPASVNFKLSSYHSPWVVFFEKMETNRIYVYDSTVVAPYALLLFGGELSVEHAAAARRGGGGGGQKRGGGGVVANSTVAVGGWIRFEAAGKVVEYVKELRRRLDDLLRRKVANPDIDMSREPLIECILELIKSDGM